jgi:hypothetical protein
MTPVGLPHSDISGSKRACRSPKLIAACHVLHRLSVPRHPPSTLSNLTIKCLDLMRSAVARLSTCCAFLFYNPYSIVNERPMRRSTLGTISRFVLTADARRARSRLLRPGIRHQGGRPRFSPTVKLGGADRDRTDDPLLAKQVLSQLSYSPGSLEEC